MEQKNKIKGTRGLKKVASLLHAMIVFNLNLKN